MIKRLIILGAASLLMGGCCHPKSHVIEPSIDMIPQQRNVDCLPSAFPKLSQEELKEDWGKELKIAQAFAKEFDLYRAITGFKRALILIPKNSLGRKLQIEYSIMEAYYLGQKYNEVVDTFEHSDLLEARPDFPAFGQMLLILYDSYRKACIPDKANRILNIIEKAGPEIGEKLKLELAFEKADFCELDALGAQDFIQEFCCEKLSVRKAQTLNAILPGAGYYYVGQKRSAITSFLINSLFTAAAYQFFHRGYIAAGVITTSIELGWYMGGINGAGLEAKEYNERLYEAKAKDFMMRQRLFPILMFETSF